MIAGPLIEVLLPSLFPCEYFKGPCADKCLWKPQLGFVPRGYFGATGNLNDVELILVTAEPGDPADGEVYIGQPEEILQKYLTEVESHFRNESLRRSGRAAPYHVGINTILSYFLPNDDFDSRWKKTWLTDAVLCSAKVSGGQIDKVVELTCGSAYLRKQLELFPSAYVLALGNKANNRIRRCGLKSNAVTVHPSFHWKGKAFNKAKWQQAAKDFRVWREVQDNKVDSQS